MIEAQNRVAVNLNQLLFAISHHQFVQARSYSNEERKARENLRQMQEEYGIGNLSLCPDGESRSEWTMSSLLKNLVFEVFSFSVLSFS
ncbi:MAG TPA: hypothetical protein VK687_02585 [Bryobacteraceae bacterium]|nr:hypothetical protein [Bryobacteraceae bacterium]